MSRKRRPQTSDLENADLENADLENTDLENADLENADLENTDLENADLENTDLAEQRPRKHRRVTNTFLKNNSLCSRAYYGRNEFKSLSSAFLFLLLFAVKFPIFFALVSNIQKSIMKGIIGPKEQLISQRRKAQIVM